MFTSQNDHTFSSQKIYCTHQIAKRLFPQLPAKGIRGLVGFFGSPMGEMKRATGHVQATQQIWQGLVAELKKQGVNSFAALDEWLATSEKIKKTKYEYPLEKEKRLGLPDVPGIYRMLAKNQTILYVGKATSLKSRVNSYFRGQKNRDAKKLEMLTQVWDISTQECATPLEAALLENDEIKKHNPPYNISLKLRNRTLIFYTKDFSDFSEKQDEEFCVGPFSHPLCFDSLERLSLSLQASEGFDELIFFEPLPSEDLQAAFTLFCESEGVQKRAFKDFRGLLALGLALYRKDFALRQVTLEDDEAEEGDKAANVDEDEPLTVEEIAAKFRRMFIRAAKTYLRVRAQTRLLNSDVELKNGNLYFRTGALANGENPRSVTKLAWQQLDVLTFDRMSILLTGLAKLRDENQLVKISPPLRFF